MFEGWHDFYLVLGPSAAALIGLLFIVVTLTAGLDRQRAIRGAQIFMTPIVFHLGVLVLLCALGLFPRMAALPMGLVTTACGLAGLAYAAYVSHAFLTKTVESYEGDLWNYGIAVSVLYAVMTAAGVLLLVGQGFAPYILATDQVALFLLMVNNAWDLVVFITPRKEDPPSPDPSGG
jgi:hypothetical protein